MSAPHIPTRYRSIATWGGKLTLRFQTKGSGLPLIYFHPAAGLHFDPFLAALSESYTVYAPEHPGTSEGDPEAIHEVDDLWDLVLIYEEAIRQLELTHTPVAIGQSFGGMMAAEIAAHFPSLFARLVLLDPIGLWRPDAPVANWMLTPPADVPALLFKDPQCPAAQMFSPPADPATAIAALANRIWAIGCTGKFAWPIPERGLAKRLHRITAPTLVVWGADDALIPAAYAAEFGKAIKGSRVEIIPNCGHIPQLEQGPTTLRLVQNFLSS
jgi:pimeloyl-ACP methyl ester carboxylesterase